MNALDILNDMRAEVEALCRECGVTRLRPTGSTAKGDFDLWAGDFQFLVEMEPHCTGAGFHAGLEKVLSGSVDLTDLSGIRSKRWRRMLDREAVDWYGA